MSAENQGAHSSSDRNAPPFRAGALSPEEIRGECPQFRILIIGKANAGKTTILRKVCNAKPDAKPIIYDAQGNEVVQEVRHVSPEPTKSFESLFKFLRRRKGRSGDALVPSTDAPNNSTDVLNPSTERGKHDIEYQLTYAGSNFIFHDSRGIESGSEDELKIVEEFIQKREQLVDWKNQLHVIWYCVPMDDHRPISGAEKAFFSLGTGRVPVVLIFTKFDALELKCYSELLEQGKGHKEASIQAPGLANDTFQKKYLPHVQEAKFPPKTYVCLSGLDKEDNQCSELSEKTMNILDDDILINLFVSTQQNNLDLCIERSIKNIWKIGTFSQMLLVYEIIAVFPNFW
ncbi:hypothetical protein M413DRAFT_132594 [Hebeloma cylindrosporum]|uniref:G domain-containing protein n=1 Tax=Hebeloma cylindrosporum TaxID=76867 RepID=A0A0C2XXI2_HEBCY|nr:hypothetical protein M413DRAFT_132594 [Hebeloma cylindrosporum h7]